MVLDCPLVIAMCHNSESFVRVATLQVMSEVLVSVHPNFCKIFSADIATREASLNLLDCLAVLFKFEQVMKAYVAIVARISTRVVAIQSMLCQMAREFF